MTSELGDREVIPSSGWRSAWALRLIILFGFSIGVWYTFSLFGAPGTDPFVVYPILVLVAFFGVLTAVFENLNPLCVVVSRTGVEFRYLFYRKFSAWADLRRSSSRDAIAPNQVALEQISNAGFQRRRYHWVTAAQAEAISRAAHWS